MSDHIDGDAPALARDAAGGVRLADWQAACLAAYLAGGNGPDAGMGMAVAMDVADAGDTAISALARVVLAWRPVVAAARAQTDAWDAASAFPNTEPLEDSGWLNATEATEAAVRALDGLGGA